MTHRQIKVHAELRVEEGLLLVYADDDWTRAVLSGYRARVKAAISLTPSQRQLLHDRLRDA